MFEVMARLKIRAGELEGFRRQAAEMMKQTRAKDTKTLRYDWYLSDDGTECEVREGYVDADALIEHAHHVAEARDTLFRDFAYDVLGALRELRRALDERSAHRRLGRPE